MKDEPDNHIDELKQEFVDAMHNYFGAETDNDLIYYADIYESVAKSFFDQYYADFYRNKILEEKTELLDALYWMYVQYCGNGHYFMGAGETASELLENAGYIEVDVAGIVTKDNGDSQEQRR